MVEIISKSAGDTELGSTVDTQKGRKELKEPLNQMSIWAKTWGMEFNVKNCKSCMWATTTSSWCARWTVSSWRRLRRSVTSVLPSLGS